VAAGLPCCCTLARTSNCMGSACLAPASSSWRALPIRKDVRIHCCVTKHIVCRHLHEHVQWVIILSQVGNVHLHIAHGMLLKWSCASERNTHPVQSCRFARSDLVDGAIVPAATSAADALIESTATDVDRVAKYLARYREVRAKRAAMEVNLHPSMRSCNSAHWPRWTVACCRGRVCSCDCRRGQLLIGAITAGDNQAQSPPPRQHAPVLMPHVRLDSWSELRPGSRSLPMSQVHLGDGTAAAAAGRDADSGSEAGSSAAVSDLSAYAAGSTVAGSESVSGAPASTVGGRRPARNARQKVLALLLTSSASACRLTDGTPLPRGVT
jgi:hypothetical protein